MVSLKESSLDIRRADMTFLESGPDLKSHLKNRTTLKLRKRKTGKQSIDGLTVGVVLVILVLTILSSQNCVILVQANVPNLRSNTLQVGGHANIPIHIVSSIKPRGFLLARTIIAFMDHKVY